MSPPSHGHRAASVPGSGIAPPSADFLAARPASSCGLPRATPTAVAWQQGSASPVVPAGGRGSPFASRSRFATAARPGRVDDSKQRQAPVTASAHGAVQPQTQTQPLASAVLAKPCFQRTASRSVDRHDLGVAAAAAAAKPKHNSQASRAAAKGSALFSVERSASSLPSLKAGWEPLTSPFGSPTLQEGCGNLAADAGTVAAASAPAAAGRPASAHPAGLRTRSSLMVPALYGAAAETRNSGGGGPAPLKTRSAKDAAAALAAAAEPEVGEPALALLDATQVCTVSTCASS